MGDTVEGDTTYENWFQREGNAFKSMCGGMVLVVILVVAIFWNEERLVKAQATADLITKAVEVPNCEPQEEDMGRLVFAACRVNAPDIADELPDTLSPFVRHFYGASLSWSAEIYQWEENEHKDCEKDSHGGETCHYSYTYERTWSSSEIDSSSFRDEYRHQNYGRLPSNLQSDSYEVPPFSVVLSGRREPVEEARGFALDAKLQRQLPFASVVLSAPEGMQRRRWDPESDDYLSPDMLVPRGGYLTTVRGTPAIGDLRIRVEGTGGATASVCAKQLPSASNEANLGPWPPEVFNFWGQETLDLEYLREGMMSKGELKKEIKSENSDFAWIMRIICLIGMIIAFQCIFQPLSTAADLLQILNYCTCCLGSLLDQAAQNVICCVSCSAACWCFTLIFVLAWCFANPTYGILGLLVMCVISVAGFVAGNMMKRGTDAREISVQTPYLKLGAEKTRIVVSEKHVVPVSV